jgi:hypothetical protein
MSFLDEFGVRIGQDLRHQKMASLTTFPFDAFVLRSEKFLRDISDVVLANAPKIFTLPGKWNPGGFLVFPLGMLDDGCSLRFHLWPRGFERESSQGPNPHNHSLHLVSRILIGSYSDIILNVNTFIPQANSDSDILKTSDIYSLYSTDRREDGHDILQTDGMLARVENGKFRKFNEGDIHHIEAGEYHNTLISSKLLTATLVLDSPSFNKSSNVLLKKSESQILRVRRNIEEVTLNNVIKQVNDYLK